MITLQDLNQEEAKSLDEYFSLIVCNYIAREKKTRRKALSMYKLADEQQRLDFREYLGSLPYELGVEVGEFVESNVKAY